MTFADLQKQKMPDWMTVNAFLAYCKPFYPEWDDQLAASLIAQFRLPGGTKLKSLSRGMRMKASLASSLAYRPKLIVLDEPFSGLDPVARDEFIQVAGTNNGGGTNQPLFSAAYNIISVGLSGRQVNHR